MSKLLRFLVIFTTLSLNDAFGQQSDLWTSTSENDSRTNLFSKVKKPKDFKLFILNEAYFNERIFQAPSESSLDASRSAFTLSFPNAEGILIPFRLVVASVMQPDLSARYPQLRQYAGVAVDGSATIRIASAPSEVSITIDPLSGPTQYVDQLDDASNTYIVVARNNLSAPLQDFNCSTIESNLMNSGPLPSSDFSADDGKLRIYKLAISTSGEWSNSYLTNEVTDAQKKARITTVLARQVTRINQIYERDFGIRLSLIDNTPIIFLNPDTDPFSSQNSPAGIWNQQVQTTLTNLIGAANYNVGHLFHRQGGDGGNSGCIGCVCNDANKGSAFTSYMQLNDEEYFLIDYVAHEIGHQFGATHTFTHDVQVDEASQVEPGSGSTIMGYAGITTQNVQDHADDLFHSVSIQRVTNNIKSGVSSTCDVELVTGNQSPVVPLLQNYTIPHSTPFELKSTATDPNAGDNLTYAWEQTDFLAAGYSSIPISTATAGPQFRAYNDTIINRRLFPKLSSILDATNNNAWEVLPSVSRELNFRFTVRDNHPGGGNIKVANMKVIVDNTYGPFYVTYPNGGEKFAANSTQLITWFVAGTQALADSVRISYSTSQGQGWETLVETDNDGSECIVIPNFITTNARLRIEAMGNIFFDITNGNFSIFNSTITPNFNFNMCNTPAFTTNNFTAIAVGKHGQVWAGTANQGLYRYINNDWQKSFNLTNNLIQDMKADQDGGIFIAQSGSSGAQAINGGINYFPDTTFSSMNYYGATLGAPTRYARSLFVDTSRYNAPSAPLLPLFWTAHMAHITGGVSTSGGLGRGLNTASPFLFTNRSGIETTNGLGSCQAIGGNANEIWVFAANNFSRGQILRYNANTGSQVLPTYDTTNVFNGLLPGLFTARAIYFDAKGHQWIGIIGQGLLVKNANVWKKVSFPELFTSNIFINTNAIAGDKTGNVYIGTTNGLIMYKAGHPIDELASYIRYTTADGLPSLNVKAIAIDTLRDKLLICTDNGIAFWKPCSSTPPIGEYTTTAAGTFETPSIWCSNLVPSAPQDIVVRHPISITNNREVRSVRIIPPGSITVNSGVTFTILQ